MIGVIWWNLCDIPEKIWYNFLKEKIRSIKRSLFSE